MTKVEKFELAKIKQDKLIKTMIYEVDTDEGSIEYRLEIYRRENVFKGIVYRKELYRMRANYKGGLAKCDEFMFSPDNNFNLNLINYNESEEDIINIFYNELEKNVSSLN
ncbi:hypothetical protein [Gilliamella sp. Fer4-1]|uniref:hypothetical protein n=1 Tax=Gilliamella sp. Fer4-1 TaxID=3120242 RepID=UPI00080E016A|nr:hypothetical protein [Gilliamella apicola]OCG63535.1 hypothetical protein A9G30_08085 [Gilliamella apicola]